MAQTIVHVDTTELLQVGEKLLFNDGVDVETTDVTISLRLTQKHP